MPVFLRGYSTFFPCDTHIPETKSLVCTLLHETLAGQTSRMCFVYRLVIDDFLENWLLKDTPSFESGTR